MRILILIPASTVSRSGNLATAERWAGFFSRMGHEPVVVSRYEGQQAELLISLHAEKCYEGLAAFRAASPEAAIVVALTGTDLYPELSSISLASLEVADHIVILQKKALDSIPAQFQEKTSVVVQSATSNVPKGDEKRDASGHFEVCIVGHLRAVKDPFLAARASRGLLLGSSIRISLAGGILEERFRELIAKEEAANSRFRWLGELDATETAKLISRSDLLVLTSLTEGGPAVIGEAVVAGTPVLSTDTDGAVGLLGEGYPGLFPVGDRLALLRLLVRCEDNEAFYQNLKDSVAAIKDQFMPEREFEALGNVVNKAVGA